MTRRKRLDGSNFKPPTNVREYVDVSTHQSGRGDKQLHGGNLVIAASGEPELDEGEADSASLKLRARGSLE